MAKNERTIVGEYGELLAQTFFKDKSDGFDKNEEVKVLLRKKKKKFNDALNKKIMQEKINQYGTNI